MLWCTTQIPFRTRRLIYPAVGFWQTALSPQLSLELLDEGIPLAQGHTPFYQLLASSDWRMQGCKGQAPVPWLWAILNGSFSFISPCGVGWGLQLGLHHSLTSLFSPAQPITSFPETQSQEYSLINLSCANFCLRVFFIGRLVYNSWYWKWSEKADTEVEIWSWVTCPLAGCEDPMSGGGQGIDKPWPKEAVKAFLMENWWKKIQQLVRCIRC